ncbi:hypothetical protein ACFQZ4_51900 [Catellatospora coxensis]|uniref:Uncharacterized protein n=1 Tax=Catellatospora coxensis TaxID=310354 RepID=A0A8J3P7X7_9ACTN|nr:hypothetical protein Cco03nite_35130 [Catellatospora coxensis]
MSGNGDTGEQPRPTIDHIMEPLLTNMPKVTDYSPEGITALGNPISMLVHNTGKTLLELFLEPSGQDYWMQPGETFTVTSYGHWNDHPFEVAHEPGCVTVWATSWYATVSFRDGSEVPGGHQRPAGKYE